MSREWAIVIAAWVSVIAVASLLLAVSWRLLSPLPHSP